MLGTRNMKLEFVMLSFELSSILPYLSLETELMISLRPIYSGLMVAHFRISMHASHSSTTNTNSNLL